MVPLLFQKPAACELARQGRWRLSVKIGSECANPRLTRLIGARAREGVRQVAWLSLSPIERMGAHPDHDPGNLIAYRGAANRGSI